MKVQKFHAGMGEAVAKRTILRKKDGQYETWEDVAKRVAYGNAMLGKHDFERHEIERFTLQKHIAAGTILMSGRHLQHGDDTQPSRNQEVFTNCSTAASSALSFYLLLNGSGVGRAYDDDLMVVDWNKAPNVVCVLDSEHADWNRKIQTPMEARCEYDEFVETFLVPDSREGWYQALELWENLAFHNPNKIKTLILDFSEVRCSGSPIGGMQDRPASGPLSLMQAFERANETTIKGHASWKAAMYVDHCFAECVLVGGARRAARIATKWWKDQDIVDFIRVKNSGELWSANNSVAVDSEFWADTSTPAFTALIDCAYGSGEPGIINVDKLNQKNEGFEAEDWSYGNDKLQPSKVSEKAYRQVIKVCETKPYNQIVNPCGEISLAIWGGYCVIADVVPYFADTLEEAESAFRTATRALIRTNRMSSIYSREVKRTNRIGVGITGVHEFAWKFFKLGFKDLVDELKSADFWRALSRFNDAVVDEGIKYSTELGMTIPHTMTTIKPAGTTSKLFGVTEGWHLPAKDFYLRWTQFRSDDPLVAEYQLKGYPSKVLKKYEGTTVVGFPTETTIATLGLGDSLVLAGEATPEEQYQWLMLGEKHWIKNEYGNQISYTLKYDPKKVSKDQFSEMLAKYQSKIKCCSVMPQVDDADLLAIYEYMPEELVSKEQFEEIKSKIAEKAEEDINRSHLECEGGSCPIDFNSGKV